MAKPSGCRNLLHLPSLIAEQMPDAVVAIDREGCIAFWNQAAEKLFHLPACVVLGRRPHDVPLPPGFTLVDEETAAAAVHRGDVVRREEVHPNGNGCPVHLELSITGLSSPDGISAGMLVVLRDVGAAKRQEPELEQQIEASRDASEPLRTLHGLVPICSHCKQIRDTNGSWKALEAYLHERCGMRFTHGICPTCIKRLDPDFDDRPPTLR